MNNPDQKKSVETVINYYETAYIEAQEKIAALTEKNEAHKYVVREMAKNISEIGDIVGFKGEESCELVAEVRALQEKLAAAVEVIRHYSIDHSREIQLGNGTTTRGYGLGDGAGVAREFLKSLEDEA